MVAAGGLDAGCQLVRHTCWVLPGAGLGCTSNKVVAPTVEHTCASGGGGADAKEDEKEDRLENVMASLV